MANTTKLQAGYLATPLDTIPVDMKLPFPIFVVVAQKMTCLRNAGDSLTPDRVESLLVKTDFVYITEAAWTQFLDHLEKVWELEKGDVKMQMSRMFYQQRANVERTIQEIKELLNKPITKE